MPRLPGPEEVGRVFANPAAAPLLDVPENPIPRAIEGLGGALTGLGGTLGRRRQEEAEERRQAQEKADRFTAQRRFMEFEDNWRTQARERMVNAPVGAEGLSAGLRADYAKQAREFFASIPDHLKPEYDAKLFDFESRLGETASEFEIKERERVAGNLVDDGVGRLRNRIDTAEDADALEAERQKAIAEGEELIQNAPLSPIERDERLRKWREEAAETAARRLARLDPEGAIDALGGNVVAVSGSVVDRIIGVESGGRANAKNPRSSASGLGQFTDDTWVATIRRHRPDIAQGKSRAELIALKTDPALGREMTERHTEDNASALDRDGFATTAGNLYLAHFAGIGGAKKVLRASDDASVADVLGNAAVSANPFLKGKTVGWLKSWAARKMGEAPAIAEQYADLPPEVREQVINEAESVIKERRIERRTIIETAIDDAPAAIEATGRYDGYTPTRQDFVDAWGEDGLARADAFETSVQIARDIHGMRGKTNDEITSLVESATPGSGPGAGLQAARHEALVRAAERVLKARETDPAGYVAESFPLVRQAWEDVPDGEVTAEAMRITAQAQAEIGIPADRITPLPKDRAAAIVDAFRNPEMAERDRIKRVRDAVLAADPAQRRQVFRQLVGAGLPEASEAALRAYARSDDAAGDRLMRAAMVNPNDLPGATEIKVTEIDQAIQDQIMGEGQVGDLFYGLSDGADPRVALRDAQTMRRAVQLRLYQGEELETAVDAVARDMFGDVQVVEESGDVNVRALVPADVDPEAVVSGLRALKGQVHTVLLRTLPEMTDVPTSDGARAVVSFARGDYIESVLEEGYYANGGKDFVYIDPYTGAAVADENGNVVSFSVEEALAAKPTGRGLSLTLTPEQKALTERFSDTGRPLVTEPEQRAGE